MKGPTLNIVEGALIKKGPRLTKVKAKVNGGAIKKGPRFYHFRGALYEEGRMLNRGDPR